jgi:hypothetical protein
MQLQKKILSRLQSSFARDSSSKNTSIVYKYEGEKEEKRRLGKARKYMSAANTQIRMNVKMTRSTILAIVVLATAISLPISFATMPAFAQPTTGTPSPSTAPGGGTTTGGGGGGDFAEFMQCLNAAGSSPTEQEVTACYDPIYGSGGGGDEDTTDGGGGDTEGGGDEDTTDGGGGG